MYMAKEIVLLTFSSSRMSGQNAALLFISSELETDCACKQIGMIRQGGLTASERHQMVL